MMDGTHYYCSFSVYFVVSCPNRESAVSLPQLWCDDRWWLLHGVFRSRHLLWSQESLSGERQVCVAHWEEWAQLYSHSVSYTFTYKDFDSAISVDFSSVYTTATRRYSGSDPQSEGSGHPGVLSQSAGDEQRGHQHWLWDTELLDWYSILSC